MTEDEVRRIVREEIAVALAPLEEAVNRPMGMYEQVNADLNRWFGGALEGFESLFSPRRSTATPGVAVVSLQPAEEK